MKEETTNRKKDGEGMTENQVEIKNRKEKSNTEGMGPYTAISDCQ
jgi:hypothetical protein